MFRLVPFVLILSLATPALAGGKGDNSSTNSPSPTGTVPTERIKRGNDKGGTRGGAPVITARDQFVQSNVIETIYHELGHALIDILDVPVLGPEEFAADMFSVILMNRMHDEEDALRLARDAARAYSEEAELSARRGRRNTDWDLHGSDMQRYYNLVCLFYGAKPRAREHLARSLELPEQRADTCPDEFAQADRAWGEVLDRIATDTPGTSIRMDPSIRANTPLIRFVTAEVARLNAMMDLPSTLTVSVRACDEVNAFYDTGDREIIYCTEYADYISRLWK